MCPPHQARNRGWLKCTRLLCAAALALSIQLGGVGASAPELTFADILTASQAAMAHVQTARLSSSVRYQLAGTDGADFPSERGCAFSGEYRSPDRFHIFWDANDGSSGEVLWIPDTVWVRDTSGLFQVYHEVPGILIDGCLSLSGIGFENFVNPFLVSDLSSSAAVDGGGIYILEADGPVLGRGASDPLLPDIAEMMSFDSWLRLEIDKETLYWRTLELTVVGSSAEAGIVVLWEFAFFDLDDPGIEV